MKEFFITINKKKVPVQEGETILSACQREGIELASLCSHPNFSDCRPADSPEYQGHSSCRLCLVKWRIGGEKKERLAPACDLLVSPGIRVTTEDKEIIRTRKTNLELLFADHAGRCAHCYRNGDCELQTLAQKYDIDEYRFSSNPRHLSYREEMDLLREKLTLRKLDLNNPSVARDSEKCIKCRRCIKVCKEIQTVEAYAFTGKGARAIVGTEFNLPLECVYCGQCTAVCPTAALTEKSQIKEFVNAVNDPEKKVITQIAPSVPFALGEEFGLPAGSVMTGQMVTALKKVGTDLVFNTNLGADLTVMEEAHELIERIKHPQKKSPLPLFTSCCPAWVLFLEQYYPDFLNNLSSCRSPHIMLGSLIKSYYASKNKLAPEKIFTVSIMPCLAKKYEASRPEFANKGKRNVDCVLTTRELGKLFRDQKINLAEIEESEFDSALGTGTSAGAIFGASGGVAEAALRTANFFLTGDNPAQLDFKEVRGDLGIKITKVNLAGVELKLGVVNGLGNARKILKDLSREKLALDFLEVMACPGGCIGGGGQPIPTSPAIRKKRAFSIYNQDQHSALRLAHENPLIEKLYQEFLLSPGSKKAEKYLHTHYYPFRYRHRG